MIALDTNVLVYAHRADSPFHDQAARVLRDLAEGTANWAIPWPCLHEFFAVATHPRIYDPPSTPAQALAQMEAWCASPTVSLLAEELDHLDVLGRLLRAGDVRGPQVHDARVAAVCLSAGVRELWSVDRDFSRFPQLRVVNPLR
ncbi:MAG TPA: TA system VapC family ribonuclease toxin [Egibacteraceae bacterium]|nr:TA system VapC family ribonuclease toxin [Egibacteraceae bacterium]